MNSESLADLPASDSKIAQVIRTRRTITLFQPDAPPQETVLQAIELATWAPNHKMTEPWRFYLLGKKTVSAIVEFNADIVRQKKGDAAAETKRQRWSGIPGWIAVTYQKADDPLRDQENYAAVCCAVQNLMLSLWSDGIGTKWTTGDVTRSSELYDLLQIDPQAEQTVGIIWYGIPATIPPSRRRPLEEVVRFHP